MDDKLLTLILIFFGVFLLARFIGSLAINQKDGSKPVNPNMSEPCPPHAWESPKQKGLGIVYQCSKCQQIYPSSADPRQRY
jgi:hypothetical protein